MAPLDNKEHFKVLVYKDNIFRLPIPKSSDFFKEKLQKIRETDVYFGCFFRA